jgi:N utilization substance protein A
MIEVEVDPKEFGRIEAQTARQILVQKIKEAERQQVYEEYKDREGEVVSGHVQRMERGSLILDLERTEGVLPFSEMPHPNNYQRGDVLKCLILEVQDSVKGPQVILSRTHETLVARLFEMEVPEIYDGLVHLKAIERDPGDRAKVAVTATVDDIDAVGTCVGVKGSRVQTVVRELDGEKIDLLEWDENPKVFIANALQPATVTRVTVDEDDNAEVIVPDDQLSLAIGRRGQNARLAARLTGWKVDIKSESEAGSQFKEEIVGELFGTGSRETTTASTQDTELDLVDLDGVGSKTAIALKDSAFPTVELVAKASVEDLSSVPGIGVKTAEKIQRAALEMLEP